jgi:hypothetical protein
MSGISALFCNHKGWYHMETERLFSSLKRQILQTPAYQGVPSFPNEVERMRTIGDLVWWLGSTDFSASPLGGDYVALSALSHLHAQLDSSHAGLMKLINFIANLDTPGYFLGHEQKHNEFPINQHISLYETADAIAAAVRRRPHLRKAVAQYIIFEHNLAGYETLTLAQLAEQVEREYTWEFGDKGFASSTRDVASALAHTETERESLRKMLTLALEIGTHHIRSRLAVNWLAQVQLRDPVLKPALERLKQMTMKQIWQQRLVYTTNDAELLEVLMRGGSFEDQQN